MDKKEKEVIRKRTHNFNYCPLVWHFCLCASARKIEQINKRCFKIVLNDNESD